MLREVKAKKKAGKAGAQGGDTAKDTATPAPVAKVRDAVEVCDLCGHEANPRIQVSRSTLAGRDVRPGQRERALSSPTSDERRASARRRLPLPLPPRPPSRPRARAARRA
jgi:hypothetical protein